MARVIYTCYLKVQGGNGRPVACSNKRILAERSSVRYDNLVRIFTRRKLFYWEDDRCIIMKVYEGDIVRGRQKLSRPYGKRFGSSN